MRLNAFDSTFVAFPYLSYSFHIIDCKFNELLYPINVLWFSSSSKSNPALIHIPNNRFLGLVFLAKLNITLISKKHENQLCEINYRIIKNNFANIPKYVLRKQMPKHCIKN